MKTVKLLSQTKTYDELVDVFKELAFDTPPNSLDPIIPTIQSGILKGVLLDITHVNLMGRVSTHGVKRGTVVHTVKNDKEIQKGALSLSNYNGSYQVRVATSSMVSSDCEVSNFTNLADHTPGIYYNKSNPFGKPGGAYYLSANTRGAIPLVTDGNATLFIKGNLVPDDLDSSGFGVMKVKNVKCGINAFNVTSVDSVHPGLGTGVSVGSVSSRNILGSNLDLFEQAYENNCSTFNKAFSAAYSITQPGWKGIFNSDLIFSESGQISGEGSRLFKILKAKDFESGWGSLMEFNHNDLLISNDYITEGLVKQLFPTYDIENNSNIRMKSEEVDLESVDMISSIDLELDI